MDRPVVRIKFVDFYPNHNPKKDKCYKALSRNFDVELSDNPEIVFASVFGKTVLNYDCVRVASIGENVTPDFNVFDYAIAFDYLEYGDRYLRAPIYAFYDEFEHLFDNSRENLTDDQLLDRGFCSFVVSNNFGDPLREEFFKKLSRYKRIDSGGRFLNNIGGPVSDKNVFCGKYKFNIAFENSSFPGYTTEKIMQPLTVSSVPIYYGDPFVTRDFFSESMVIVRDKHDIDRAIEEIIYLDTHDDEYLKKCRARTFLHGKSYYEDKLADFLKHIVLQPSGGDRRRTACYGNQLVHRRDMQNYAKLDKLMTCRLFRKVSHIFGIFT